MPLFVRLIFAVLAPLAIVMAIGVWMVRPGPPDQAKRVVAQYVEYRTGVSLARQHIVPRYVHAGRPQDFTPALHMASFGSGYYATTYDFMTPHAVALSGMITPGQLADVGAGHGLRWLPQTVADAWCVHLSDTQSPPPRVVLVGQHLDLYQAEWVIYEPVAQTTADLNAWLAGIGCPLVLTP